MAFRVIRREPIAALLLTLGAVLLIHGLATDSANAAKTKIVSSTSTISTANQAPRQEALCPKAKAFNFPYGGAMFSSPAPTPPDGEGAYPRSYERLGVQHGFHATPVLFDPSTATTLARTVTTQAVCGPEPGKLSQPQASTFISPGGSQSLTVTCPGPRQLLGGGFQRTNFTGKSGSFATESEATSSKTWAASGQAFGNGGGELATSGYCLRSPKPLIREVTASTVIVPGMVGSATTPACTGGRRLVFSGFNTSPAGSILFAGGPINADQSVVGSGYNRSMAPATLTVEGYCLKITTPPAKKK